MVIIAIIIRCQNVKMLDMPRHVSQKHLPMNRLTRAAIFSPFAALTGFDGKILDAQHKRCNRILLSDDEMAPINAALNESQKCDSVEVTYFVYDPGTDGAGGFSDSEYLTVSGVVTKLETAFHTFRAIAKDSWVDLKFEDILSIQIR